MGGLCSKGTQVVESNMLEKNYLQLALIAKKHWESRKENASPVEVKLAAENAVQLYKLAIKQSLQAFIVALTPEQQTFHRTRIIEQQFHCANILYSLGLEEEGSEVYQDAMNYGPLSEALTHDLGRENFAYLPQALQPSTLASPLSPRNSTKNDG